MRDERLDKAFEAWVEAQSTALDVVREATGSRRPMWTWPRVTAG